MLHRVCASVLFALALLIAVDASAAAPQRTFVASYGNDGWPCSLVQPCRGFQAAINAVAAGGEVVALDSAGYGAMEIHKSVSVIVPPGVHAGLSPSSGIPLPGYPGQTGVVLIDIQDTDVVVLRGLNINHQGTVTGGIEWISTNGGKVHIESVVVNGFSEGVYMQAPSGALLIKDSIFRNNGIGIYGGVTGDLTLTTGIWVDHTRIEHSASYGIRVLSGVQARLSNSTLFSNNIAIHVQGNTQDAALFLDRCAVISNENVFKLEGTAPAAAVLDIAGSTVVNVIVGAIPTFAQGIRIGTTHIRSWGNNLTSVPLDSPGTPQ